MFKFEITYKLYGQKKMVNFLFRYYFKVNDKNNFHTIRG